MSRKKQRDKAPQQGAVMRLIDRALLSHLRAIDEEYIDPKRTSDGKILFSVYASCLLLFALNYVVLDLEFQRKVAGWLVRRLGLWNSDGHGITRNEMRLTMRIAWTLGCFTLYLIIPTFLHVFILKRPLKDMGLGLRGFVKHSWIYAPLFLPVFISVFVVSHDEAFQSTYPFYRNPESWKHLLAWEAFYGLQFLSLEYFFRGFMLNELKYRLGWRAVLFMIVPYCMIHFSKPSLEAAGSIIAGTVLGFLALRTKNIWGGVSIHVAVAWSMDITSLWQRGWFDRISGN